MATSKKASNNSTTKDGEVDAVRIKPPNWRTIAVTVIGTTPYVQSKFSQKARQQMEDKQKAGTLAAVKKKVRAARDFDADYECARYKPAQGDWPNGAIPATQFRAAMIGAGRLIDFAMTLLRVCIFVEADSFDPDDLTPLVKVIKGKPAPFKQALPNSGGGHDIRIRPKWDEGWQCALRIKYDADRLTSDEVVNLLARAGEQVGIGEGRMASRKCAGVGWGAFRVANADDMLNGASLEKPVPKLPGKKKKKIKLFD